MGAMILEILWLPPLGGRTHDRQSSRALIGIVFLAQGLSSPPLTEIGSGGSSTRARRRGRTFIA